MSDERNLMVFSGSRCVVSGDLATVLLRLKSMFDQGDGGELVVFDEATGAQVDFDLRGTYDEVLSRAQPEAPRVGPGRPKLGVVSREVSLLPRHWEWLEAQTQGISGALRRLVDDARKRDPHGERVLRARGATSKFMTAVAGNLQGYEEALRALYAGDVAGFRERVGQWPDDVRDHVLRLAGDAFRTDDAPTA